MCIRDSRKLHRKMSPSWAMTTYTVGLAAITILPIATVVSLVTPQAVAGLKILDGLRDSGWIHSPEAQAWFASVDAWLKNLPGLEGGLDQLASTAAGLAGTAARTVLAGGVGIAGGAFQAVLVLFLFVMIDVYKRQGFLGALTTFSTFSMDTLAAFHAGHPAKAVPVSYTHLVVGLAADMGPNAPIVLAYQMVRLYTIILTVPLAARILHKFLS